MEHVYDPQVAIYWYNYATAEEYMRALLDCRKHYGYKARVAGGWRFFEFESDYRAWKEQK